MSKKLSSRNTTPDAAKRDRYGMTEADALHRELSSAVIAFHETLSRHAGMSAAERRVFSLLAMLGEATPGQLARQSGFTTGAITGIVDRLERAGYAERKPHPNDRRSLIVRPLQIDKVSAQVTPAFQSLTEAMNDVRKRYSRTELDTIHNYLAATTDVLKHETAKLEKRPRKK